MNFVCERIPTHGNAFLLCGLTDHAFYGLRFNRGTARWLLRGNTSGNWITTFLNTLYNYFYFAVSTIHIVHSVYDPKAEVDFILSQLLLRLYSDDNIVANRVYNIRPSLYSAAFKDLFVVTLTSTSKGELEDQLIPIDDVEFLSRAFFKDGQFVKCPLSYDSIVSQLYYVRLPKSEQVNSCETMES